MTGMLPPSDEERSVLKKVEGADILRAELVELLGLSEPHDNHTGIVEEIKVYHQIFEEVSKVYCEVTGGRISKPNTYASEVISEYEQQVQRERDEAIREELPEGFEPGMMFPDGQEAEELRRRLEQLMAGQEEVSVDELQRVLDEVDARDSLHACILTERLEKATGVIEAARRWRNRTKGIASRGPIVRALIEAVDAYDKAGGGA